MNTGSKLVVIDTGTGEANFERSKGAAGQFHGNLKASGIDRNQVDTVIISHFHGDHINGLITADNKPAFPNAEILVPAVEWKYFMDDAEMGKQTTERMKGVFAGLRRVFDALNRKVTTYESDKELAPGITSVATYGHTPGHHSFVVASASARSTVVLPATTERATACCRRSSALSGKRRFAIVRSAKSRRTSRAASDTMIPRLFASPSRVTARTFLVAARSSSVTSIVETWLARPRLAAIVTA